jgi:hypothetical protein
LESIGSFRIAAGRNPPRIKKEGKAYARRITAYQTL